MHRTSVRRAASCGLAALSLLLTGLLAGCGSDHAVDPADADRVVEITMTDNAFDPEMVDASVGETLTLRFTNEGTVTHEAVIGDADVQAEHDAAMTDEPGDGSGDGHGHAGHDAVTVAAGETGELTVRFDEAGELFIGCHESGHYDDGMVATIVVR